MQPPVVPRLEATPLSKECESQIERHVRDLSNIGERDLYLNSSLFDPKFVPIGEFGDSGNWTGKPIEVSRQVRSLIEIGPDALPFLLASLEDDAPTNVVIHTFGTRGAVEGGMAFDEILHGNPANPTERFTLRLNRDPHSASIRTKNALFVAPEMESYRIKIGDVCLIVIGQIVGREYECLSSPHVKSAGILVCSPVHRNAVPKRLRDIWASKHPRQKLLESLVLDFSTRGVLQGESLDYWDIGNDFQIEATKRLLYYYPDIAVPLIVERIKNLRSTGDYIDDCKRNGLRAEYFVDAIAWSKDEQIKSALTDLAANAQYEPLRRALLRAGVKPADQE